MLLHLVSKNYNGARGAYEFAIIQQGFYSEFTGKARNTNVPASKDDLYFFPLQPCGNFLQILNNTVRQKSADGVIQYS